MNLMQLIPTFLARFDLDDFPVPLGSARRLDFLRFPVEIVRTTNQRQVSPQHFLANLLCRWDDEPDFRLPLWRHSRSAHREECRIYVDRNRGCNIDFVADWSCKVQRELFWKQADEQLKSF